MKKLVCLPCEIQHREFDSKLMLAARLAASGDCVVMIGYDKYFNSILNTVSNCFLLEKSMSTIMLHSRIKPCKSRGGIIFVNDEEGVNDLEETPHGLDIRADPLSVDYIDKFLAWGSDDALFYGSKKLNLKDKIVITGSHRYDLLNDIGRSFYSEDIRALSNIFGPYILYNDNLAVDHYDESYTPPMHQFNSDNKRYELANNEWTDLVSEHTSRRLQVRDFLLSLAHVGFHIVVRPHPVYDPLFWHQSFRLTPNISTIYNGPVEPWIHAASALITTGCTTGLQALLADKPSFELPIGHSNAFSSSVLPVCESYKALLPSSIETMNSIFHDAKQQTMKRWHYCQSTTALMSNLISDAISGLPDQKNYDWVNSIKSLTPGPPKWRDLTTVKVRNRLKSIIKTLHISESLKCSKVANSLYAIH